MQEVGIILPVSPVRNIPVREPACACRAVQFPTVLSSDFSASDAVAKRTDRLPSSPLGNPVASTSLRQHDVPMGRWATRGSAMKNESMRSECACACHSELTVRPVWSELILEVTASRERLGADADYDTVISDLRNLGYEITMEELTIVWDPSD